MRKTRIAAAVVAAGVIVLAGCGSSDDGDTAATTAAAESTEAPAETTAAPETTAAAAETTAAAAETTAAAAETTAAAEAAGGAVDVNLVEWAIEAPTELAAGEVTFNVVNTGEFPHELVVVQGDSYDTLPLTANGAVDETQLPAGALIGETARLGNGETESLTVSLAAGNYVLLCNISGGGSSHAARGQVLSVTVA